MSHRIQRRAFVNVYLVEEDDGLTLVDTSLPGGAQTIVAAADGLGKPITRIALTHAHGDHIGSLDALRGQLPDAEVLISARDVRLLKKDLSLDEGEEGKIKGLLPGAKTEPTRLVSDGDTIGSLQVVGSPGHTPGHLAFYDPRDGTLYCGDVYTSWGGVIATSAAFNWRFPLALGGTWNRPLDVESARKLRAMDPKALAPGHGKVIENPGAGMDNAIAKAS